MTMPKGWKSTNIQNQQTDDEKNHSKSKDKKMGVSSEKKNINYSVKKNHKIIHHIIRYIIISGWIVVALITCIVIIYDYGMNQDLKLHWHIAFALFVIVLACSFFLQTMFIEIENRNDLRNKAYIALNQQHKIYHSKQGKK